MRLGIQEIMKKELLNFLFLFLPLATFAQWGGLGVAMEAEAPNDNFGWASEINAAGDVLVIGGYGNDGNGYYAGHARVFEWDGTSWNQRGADIDGVGADQWSGWQVAIDASGNTIAITSLIANNAIGLPSGVVRVFDWDGTNWNQRGGNIDGEGDPNNFLDWFGAGLSFSANSNVLAIGGPLNRANGTNAGHIRVYEWDGTNWGQRGVDIYGQSHDEFGYSVSLNDAGDILAVGATGNTGFGTSPNGYVKIYNWNGTSWMQQGNLVGDLDGDEFGRSVSLNAVGDVLAVGAPGHIVGSANINGSTYVYEWNGTNWIPRGGEIVGLATGNGFGEEVSLNSAGTILAASAPAYLTNGNVRIFEWTGTAWSQLGNTITGDALNDIFGASLSLNSTGDIVAVGAWGNQNQGHVRVFQNPLILSNQDLNEMNLNYFPNPTDNAIQLSASSIIEVVKLFDVSGKELMSLQGTQREITIELNPLNPGTYFLELRSKDQVRTVKIVKQ